MQNTAILSHKDLCARIQFLKTQKLNEEVQLRQTFNGFVDTINPISIAKRSLYALVADSEVHFALAKVGLNIGANLIIEQVLGKNRSVKGFFRTILVEIFSNSYINSHVSEIMTMVSQLMSPDKEPETNNEF